VYLIIFYVTGGGAISTIQSSSTIPDLTNVKSNSDLTIVASRDPDILGKTSSEIIAAFTVSSAGKLVAI